MEWLAYNTLYIFNVGGQRVGVQVIPATPHVPQQTPSSSMTILHTDVQQTTAKEADVRIL